MQIADIQHNEQLRENDGIYARKEKNNENLSFHKFQISWYFNL